MKNIKTYLNILDQHRDEMALALMSDPGLSKTSQCKQWCEEHGRRYFEFITSQRMPSEISGMAMPDQESKRMKIYDFDYLLDMKDGDMLAFDEFTNGNIMTLNACLTLIQERNMMSGRKLPSILIVAMGNPQGKCDMLPQTKQRFIWLNVKFDGDTWVEWVEKELGVTPTKNLVDYIKRCYESGFDVQKYNYMTTRTVTNLLKLAKTVDKSSSIWSNMYQVSSTLVNELYKSVAINNSGDREYLKIMKSEIDRLILGLQCEGDDFLYNDDIGLARKKFAECNTVLDIKAVLSAIENNQYQMTEYTKARILDRLKDSKTQNTADTLKLLKALKQITSNGDYSRSSVLKLQSFIEENAERYGAKEVLRCCLLNQYGGVGTRLYTYAISKQLFPGMVIE